MFSSRIGFFSTITQPGNLTGWITYFDANNTTLGGNIVSDGTNVYWAVTTGTGGGDIQLISLDSNGNVNWQKNYKPSYTSTDNAGSILIDTGNIYVCGNTDHSSSNTSNDGLLFKTNFDGNITWQKQIGNASSGSNAFNDAITDMAFDSTKTNIFGAGYANGSTPLVTKYDTGGNLLLQKTSNVASTNGYYSIACDSTNNVYVTYNDGLIKLDSNLSFLYSKANTNLVQCKCVTVDNNDNVYFFADLSNNDSTIFKLDSTGTLLYEKTISNVYLIQGAVTDPSNNLYIIGQDLSSGNAVAYMAKFDSSGNIIWQSQVKSNTISGTNVGMEGITYNGDYVYVYARNTPDTNEDQCAFKIPNTGIPNGSYGNIVIATANATLSTTSTTLSNTSFTLSNSTWATSDSNLAAANTSFTFTKYTL